MCCGKQNIALQVHRKKKVDQTTVSGLSSASDGPGILLLDKEARSPGNFIALLEFQAKTDAAAYLRDFHRNGHEGKQVNYLSPKIQHELTDCSTSLSSGQRLWVHKKKKQ